MAEPGQKCSPHGPESVKMKAWIDRPIWSDFPYVTAAAAGLRGCARMESFIMRSKCLTERLKQPIDLSSSDIAHIQRTAWNLHGGWAVRCMQFYRGLRPRVWMYVFRTWSAPDASPILAIFRTSRGYLVVTWDFLLFSGGWSVPTEEFETIGETSTAIETYLSDVLEIESSSLYDNGCCAKGDENVVPLVSCPRLIS